MSISDSDSPLGAELESVQEGSITLSLLLPGCCQMPWQPLLRAKCSYTAARRERVVPGVPKPMGLFCSESIFWAAAQCVWLNSKVPCSARGRGGLPRQDTPHAAWEITLYTKTTIYLWYVLIYNIHCVH